MPMIRDRLLNYLRNAYNTVFTTITCKFPLRIKSKFIASWIFINIYVNFTVTVPLHITWSIFFILNIKVTSTRRGCTLWQEGEVKGYKVNPYIIFISVHIAYCYMKVCFSLYDWSVDRIMMRKLSLNFSTGKKGEFKPS